MQKPSSVPCYRLTVERGARRVDLAVPFTFAAAKRDDRLRAFARQEGWEVLGSGQMAGCWGDATERAVHAEELLFVRDKLGPLRSRSGPVPEKVVARLLGVGVKLLHERCRQLFNCEWLDFLRTPQLTTPLAPPLTTAATTAAVLPTPTLPGPMVTPAPLVLPVVSVPAPPTTAATTTAIPATTTPIPAPPAAPTTILYDPPSSSGGFDFLDLMPLDEALLLDGSCQDADLNEVLQYLGGGADTCNAAVDPAAPGSLPPSPATPLPPALLETPPEAPEPPALLPAAAAAGAGAAGCQSTVALLAPGAPAAPAAAATSSAEPCEPSAAFWAGLPELKLGPTPTPLTSFASLHSVALEEACLVQCDPPMGPPAFCFLF